jgi:hypothetical protein
MKTAIIIVATIVATIAVLAIMGKSKLNAYNAGLIDAKNDGKL